MPNTAHQYSWHPHDGPHQLSNRERLWCAMEDVVHQETGSIGRNESMRTPELQPAWGIMVQMQRLMSKNWNKTFHFNVFQWKILPQKRNQSFPMENFNFDDTPFSNGKMFYSKKCWPALILSFWSPVLLKNKSLLSAGEDVSRLRHFWRIFRFTYPWYLEVGSKGCHIF